MSQPPGGYQYYQQGDAERMARQSQERGYQVEQARQQAQQQLAALQQQLDAEYSQAQMAYQQFESQARDALAATAQEARMAEQRVQRPNVYGYAPPTPPGQYPQMPQFADGGQMPRFATGGLFWKPSQQGGGALITPDGQTYLFATEIQARQFAQQQGYEWPGGAYTSVGTGVSRPASPMPAPSAPPAQPATGQAPVIPGMQQPVSGQGLVWNGLAFVQPGGAPAGAAAPPAPPTQQTPMHYGDNLGWTQTADGRWVNGPVGQSAAPAAAGGPPMPPAAPPQMDPAYEQAVRDRQAQAAKEAKDQEMFDRQRDGMRGERMGERSWGRFAKGGKYQQTPNDDERDTRVPWMGMDDKTRVGMWAGNASAGAGFLPGSAVPEYQKQFANGGEMDDEHMMPDGQMMAGPPMPPGMDSMVEPSAIVGEGRQSGIPGYRAEIIIKPAAIAQGLVSFVDSPKGIEAEPGSIIVPLNSEHMENVVKENMPEEPGVPAFKKGGKSGKWMAAPAGPPMPPMAKKPVAAGRKK